MPRLKAVVVDCEHAPSQAHFWAAAIDGCNIRPYDDAELERLVALGYTPETDPTVMVDTPIGTLCFQQVAEGKRAKNRVHLDLVSDDRGADAERLIAMGASMLSEYDDHTVLAEPEGNEFCLYEPD